MKLTKDQRRKKKIVAAKKAQLRKRHESNQIKNARSALIQPFSDVTEVSTEEPTEAILTEAQYSEIFSEYKNLASHEERIAYLTKKEQEFDLAFDVEEILELCVDEILINEPMDSQLYVVLKNVDLRWIDIVRCIEASKYIHYSGLMRSAIQVCGYALE